jgi:hypothetical protein
MCEAADEWLIFKSRGSRFTRMIRIGLMAVLAGALWVAPALAQENGKNAKNAGKGLRDAGAAATNGAQRLGRFGDWGAFVGGSGNNKVCFVLSQPKERQPKGLNRDPAYLFISSRPAAGVRSEVALITGYAVKDGSQPIATIGNASFGLLTKDGNAWLQNAAEESKFVQAARSGSALVVRGTSQRGNNLSDRYSLAGLGQAMDAAQKGCR